MTGRRLRWPWVRRSRLDACAAALTAELARHHLAERQLLVGLHSLQWFPIDRENDRLRRALEVAAFIVREAAPNAYRPGPVDPDTGIARSTLVHEWLAEQSRIRDADVMALGLDEPPPEVVAAAKALPVTHPPSTTPED